MVAGYEQDSLVESIIKWIPVEVLMVYKTIDNLVPDGAGWHRGLVIAGIVITALWIAFATKPNDKPIAWRQVILAPFAFTCWAIGMRPTVMPMLQKGYESNVGSAVLAGGTLLLPILDGILKKAGIRQN